MSKRQHRIALALFVLSGSLVACSERAEPPAKSLPPEVAGYEAETMAQLDAYEREALMLAQGISQGDPTGELLAGIERLFELADAMMPAFLARHPGCTAYLEAARQVRHRWQDMDVATLERDYHDDGALPSAGATPACYHIKDLMVHPASAAALISLDTPDANAARREIAEVLSHLDVVRRG